MEVTLSHYGVPANGHIRVSYIGYKTIEVLSTDKPPSAINPSRGHRASVDRMVVTALGIKRSKALSYNVKSNESLPPSKTPTLLALNGKVAGVNIPKVISWYRRCYACDHAWIEVYHW